MSETYTQERMNYRNSLPLAFCHPTIICPANHPPWGSVPLTLDGSSSEIFTYSKTSRITLTKENVSLNPTEAWVLEYFFNAIQQYHGFHISLANRIESKNVITNCTCESKHNNAVRNPETGLLQSPPFYQGPESGSHSSQNPKQVRVQDQSQLSCLWSRAPPPKLFETITFSQKQNKS